LFVAARIYSTGAGKSKPQMPAVRRCAVFVGVLPFIVTDLIRLVILIAFPIIALYLPTRM